jgi:hypothetical protein
MYYNFNLGVLFANFDLVPCALCTDCITLVASMDPGGAPVLENRRGMTWKWILEKVVRCPDFGTTFSKGFSSRNPKASQQFVR